MAKQKYSIDPAHPGMGQEMDSARWTLPPVVPVLIAFAVLAAVFGWYSYHERPGMISHAKVEGFRTYAQHFKTAQVTDRHMTVVTNPDEYDQLLVLAHINLKDVNDKKTLTLKSIDAKLDTGTDQGELTATQSTHEDQEQALAAYKEIADFKMAPLRAGQELKPGQETTGLVMFSFPVSQEVWKNRKDFTITLSFYDQNPLVLHIPQGS
jgi:hypothetical protein